MSEADDRAAVDRAFADLVAGFHKTAERPDSGQPSDWDESVSAVPEAPAPGSVFETPTIEVPQIEVSQIDLPDDEEEPEPIREERYDPGPVAPLPRPSWPVLVGWIGIGSWIGSTPRYVRANSMMSGSLFSTHALSTADPVGLVPYLLIVSARMSRWT